MVAVPGMTSVCSVRWAILRRGTIPPTAFLALLIQQGYYQFILFHPVPAVNSASFCVLREISGISEPSEHPELSGIFVSSELSEPSDISETSELAEP